MASHLTRLVGILKPMLAGDRPPPPLPRQPVSAPRFSSGDAELSEARRLLGAPEEPSYQRGRIIGKVASVLVLSAVAILVWTRMVGLPHFTVASSELPINGVPAWTPPPQRPNPQPTPSPKTNWTPKPDRSLLPPPREDFPPRLPAFRPPPPGLRVQSVITSGSRKACLINNMVYREHDEVAGFTIDRIMDTGVTLVRDGERIELPIGQ